MKKKRSGRYRLGFVQKHQLVPVLVWLAVVVCVVGLFYRRYERFEIVGLAQGQVRQVAATCTGRLQELPVGLYHEVKQGQVVAVIDTVLDNEPIQAQLASIAAEIEHLMAQLLPRQEQLLAEAANLETSHVADERTFAVDVEDSRLQTLQLRAQIASDRITLQDLKMEVGTLQYLVQQDAVGPYELERVKAQHEALAQKIEENERALEQAQEHFRQAQQRLDEFRRRQMQHPSVDSALEVIRKEAKVQERRMEELRARCEPLELTAPIDGMIVPIPAQTGGGQRRGQGERVLTRPGEVVTAGDPILAVAELQPSEIVAYVGQSQVGQVHEQMTVELVKNREPAQIAESKVVSVGPTIELMPQRLWRNPNVPQWGRPIMISIPAGMELLPGEMVGIRQL
jgi:multidrug resistance efflux pump